MSSNNNGNDPAPHPLDLHVERITQLIDTVTAHARERTRQMRDRMDAVLKAIQECAESLRNDIERYQRLARELDDVIKVAAEPFDQLADKFRVQAPVTPAPAPAPAPPPVPETRLPSVRSFDKTLDKKPLEMTLSPETDMMLTKLAYPRKDAG